MVGVDNLLEKICVEEKMSAKMLLDSRAVAQCRCSCLIRVAEGEAKCLVQTK